MIKNYLRIEYTHILTYQLDYLYGRKLPSLPLLVLDPAGYIVLSKNQNCFYYRVLLQTLINIYVLYLARSSVLLIRGYLKWEQTGADRNEPVLPTLRKNL